MPEPAASQTMPFPVLIGDIGGTNARFALVPDETGPLQIFPSVETADFPTFEDAIRAAVLERTSLRPRSAIIDLAGPIGGDEVPLTNGNWRLRPLSLMPEFGMEDIILLNDFEALALALTALRPEDLVAIGGGAADPAGAKVVIGPGTGLGVGALIQAAGLWAPVPGEGGHVAFGPDEADEFPLWKNIEPEFGRISAEALLCGRGMVRLHRAVALTEGRESPLTTPAEITRLALAGSDPLAVRTVSLWARFLGRLAGDMALVFMARGGVYIGGGIPPRIVPFLQSDDFRRAFEQKAPHRAVMAQIPTWVIVGENPALQGLAAYARAPERFGVNLVGRRWQS